VSSATTPPRWRSATPREAALAILAARFADAEESATAALPLREQDNPLYTLTDFQQDAVRRARLILTQRRGVLIADSVGLGKTYIALALIDYALRSGERVGVVTPAALRGDWIGLLRKLAASLGVPETRGIHGLDEERNAPITPPNRAPFLAWTSHTRLGRGAAPAELHAGLDLVVVDEAHAFRNPRTRRYRALAELSRTARLVLITATPVNNSLADLYALIRLFAGDDAFHDLGIPDLGGTIRAAATAPRTGQRAPSLQPLLRAIMIRRTREIVGGEMPAKSGLRFPRRAPPRAIRYALDRVYDGFLPELASTLDALTLAPFRLADYGAAAPGTTTVAPAELIRLGLLKRLESSLTALRTSIARQLRFAEACLASLERGLLRLPADHRALYGRGDLEGTQFNLEELTLRPLPPDLDTARLRRDLLLDRQRLHTLHQQLTTLRAAADPKLTRLRQLLEDELRGEKVVVFTEFRETARYLWRELRGRGATALIDGGGAFLGTGPAGRQEVVTRFAPRANHAPPPPPHERVDLLLATDVLAEGLNLQDARHVISYDLPWNPVRLLQRMGRVDRFASPHNVVHPYHFLPDYGLDELLRLIARLRTKLGAIQQTVGEEFEVMGKVEASFGRYDLLAGAEELLRAAYLRAKGEGQAGGGAAAVAAAATTTATTAATSSYSSVTSIITAAIPSAPGSRQSVLIACRIAGQVVFLVHHPARGTAALEDDDAAAEIFLAALAPSDPAIPALEPDPTLLARAWRAAQRTARNRRAFTSAAAPLPANAPGARAARRLLANLAAAPGDPDPALSRRTDRLLSLLAHRHDAGTEVHILAALRQYERPRQAEFAGQTGTPDRRAGPHDHPTEAAPPGSGPDPAVTLIRALEEVLLTGDTSGNAVAPAPSSQQEEIELIGIIERRPTP
jgi:superfamily II DNA or RNA helicase